MILLIIKDVMLEKDKEKEEKKMNIFNKVSIMKNLFYYSIISLN